jgi:hypothetical protein
MTLPGVCSAVRQLLLDIKLLSHESPIFIEPFKSSDEISEQIPVGIDKPVQLVSVRRGMYARRATVLNPIHKLFEAHLVPELQCFGAFVKGYNPVPRITNKSKFEI